jgi:hypothetical protein
MYLLLLTAAGAGALLFAAVQWLPHAPEQAAQRAQAQAQLQQYQVFLYASRSYFASTAAPAVTTAYDWSVIRTAAVTSMTQAGMPPHWKAVRRPDGYWVACTELTETTLAKLPTLFLAPLRSAAGASAPALLALTVPAGSISAVVGTGGGAAGGTPSYVVLGLQGGDAATSANLCGGT